MLFKLLLMFDGAKVDKIYETTKHFQENFAML